MKVPDKFKPLVNILKLVSLYGSGAAFIAYHVGSSCGSLKSLIVQTLVSTNVSKKEKKHIAEYIYIDDPSYTLALKADQDNESRQSSFGFTRIWKSLKHSLAWRLLWLCRHGSKEQRNIALQQLAAFKNNKHWDCLKLAQAMDKHTAVLLARTRGADQRYFLPPPIHIRRAALSSEHVSFRFRDMINAVQMVNPHSCIQHFLSKYFVNIQEQILEADNDTPSKLDSISERDLCLLCLDALHHHVSLFHKKLLEEDMSTKLLIKMGLLRTLAELFLRFKGDADIDIAILRILTVLSVHCHLLDDFFQNGLIGELTRLLKSSDVRLASSAAVCLANLSGEHCYRPGLYLLHPLYRTTAPHSCDILLVHGLRGGVFVTWRQRDKKCTRPLGIMEVTYSEVDSDSCDTTADTENPEATPFLDPDIKQVIEDLKVMEEQALLSDFEVILHDTPTEAKREPPHDYYVATNKRTALIQEKQDRQTYTYCWPKDWLPKDCSNLRILGFNYWSSLSEWLERCPLQGADISSRALELAPVLLDAGVGKKDTPVVWLAHSMGGLIVKQVLVEAAKSMESSWNKLCENTKALLFYSTPHKGSPLASMPRAAAAVLWPSNDVRQLQVDSPILVDLHDTFVKLADKYAWETISFSESKPTLVTAFKVPVQFVQADSADLGRGQFYELPLDHLCICKPATRQSVLYTTALDVILRVTNKKEELAYPHPNVQFLIRLFQFLFTKNSKSLLESMDESNPNPNDLRWFERMLLDTFTDF